MGRPGRISSTVSLCGLLSALLFPGRVAASSWSHDIFADIAVAGPSNNQELSSMASDGTGGAYFAWTDQRGGLEDVYLQHLTAAGAVAIGWPATGFQVCTTASRKLEPQLVADGAGGVLVVWTDYRAGAALGHMYAARMNGDGSRASGFPAAGVQLSISGYNELHPQACSDGAGGALVAWEGIYSATDTDIYGAHVSGAGALAFSAALDYSTADCRKVSVATDGAGGYFAAYQDSSSVGFRIFAVHTNGAGVVLAGPLRISNSPYSSARKTPRIVADGHGGFGAAWMDNELDATFDLAYMGFGSALTPGPYWYDLGVVVTGGISPSYPDFGILPDGEGGYYCLYVSASGSQDLLLSHASPAGTSTPPTVLDLGSGLYPAYNQTPQMVSDGSGGVIIAGIGSAGRPYALRITSAGQVAARWPYGGVALAGYPANVIAAASDGAHGAIVGWSDAHTGGGTLASETVYAGRVDRFGALGDASPAIVSVKDAPKDQGGQVRLVWNPSYLDSDPNYEIGSYWIWRQTPAAAAARAVRNDAHWATGTAALDSALAARGRLFRPAAAEGYAWEYVATQNANAGTQYSFVSPTTLDSTGAGNPCTAFMVEAHSSWSVGFWDSAPDSGYSVDNLPPVTPAPFTGQYAAGSAFLHWDRNTEADLAGYRLYRGSSVAFVPGPGNLLTSLPDTGYTDVAGAPYVYKLTAIDVHGNESPPATLVPTGTTGVGAPPPPRELAFAAPMPNPAAEATALRYALPQAAAVRLAIYDAAGRLVRELLRASRQAGTYAEPWDLRDAGGRTVGAGLYFARLDVGGRTLVQRVAVTR